MKGHLASGKRNLAPPSWKLGQGDSSQPWSFCFSYTSCRECQAGLHSIALNDRTLGCPQRKAGCGWEEDCLFLTRRIVQWELGIYGNDLEGSRRRTAKECSLPGYLNLWTTPMILNVKISRGLILKCFFKNDWFFWAVNLTKWCDCGINYQTFLLICKCISPLCIGKKISKQ